MLPIFVPFFLGIEDTRKEATFHVFLQVWFKYRLTTGKEVDDCHDFTNLVIEKSYTCIQGGPALLHSVACNLNADQIVMYKIYTWLVLEIKR